MRHLGRFALLSRKSFCFNSFQVRTSIMGPKRKPDDELSSSKKAKEKKVQADEEADGGDEEGGGEGKKGAGAGTMAQYMPKSYAEGAYSNTHHISGSALKIVSYNVNGINACVEKGLIPYLLAENADVVAIQETKLQDSKIPAFDKQIAALGYQHRYWSCSQEKKGYSGTAVFSKVEPVRVSYGLGPHGAHNEEGRTINVEFDTFHLVNCYVPNSGQKLERLGWRADVWDRAMLQHLQFLETGVIAGSSAGSAAGAGEAASPSKTGGGGVGSNAAPSAKSTIKPVILTGDLNVAHEQVDLKNWKTNQNKTAGFCDAERQGMSNFLAAGFEDTYRRLNPSGTAYTYWGMRFNSYGGDSGWRIDYFLCSRALRDRVCGMETRREVYGASDHCPIVLILKK
jgi:exodeoxyribonuclease-3